MTAVVCVRKGQTDMPYKGEHHTLTKQSMRNQNHHRTMEWHYDITMDHIIPSDVIMTLRI